MPLYHQHASSYSFTIISKHALSWVEPEPEPELDNKSHYIMMKIVVLKCREVGG